MQFEYFLRFFIGNIWRYEFFFVTLQAEMKSGIISREIEET